MFVKKKRSGKIKGKIFVKGRPHQEYITKEESSLPIISSYDLTGLCLMNTMDYNFNYKLRSLFGQEDYFITNTWTWFDMKVRNTLL